MTHTNRGRLTVDTNGNWRLYTNTIPVNSTPLGTVTRDESDTGALVRIAQPSPLAPEHLAQASRIAREAGDIYIEARNARH